MSYDRADYDPERDAVRIAFFVAWAMLNGCAGPLHQEEDGEILNQLRQREITPRKFLEVACDNKFWEEDLSDVGNAFARAYYETRPGRGGHFDDYARMLVVGNDLSAVADHWDNYDRIAPVISQRHDDWVMNLAAAEQRL